MYYFSRKLELAVMVPAKTVPAKTVPAKIVKIAPTAVAYMYYI